MIYIVLVLGFPVVVFICDFVFAPGLTKNVVAHKKQIIILNSGASMVEYRRKNNITSFEDEKTFLNNKINSIEDFYQEMEIEGWNKKDKHPEWKGLSEMNDEQIAILDRMRSLSLFQECHASVVETRAKVGIGWVIIGFMFAVELAVFVVMLDKTNIGF